MNARTHARTHAHTLGLAAICQPQMFTLNIWYRVYVLCDVLPPIHTYLNLISLRLVTGIVIAGLLDNMTVNYSVISTVK